MKISITTDNGFMLLCPIDLDFDFAEKVRALRATTGLDETERDLFDSVVDKVTSVMPDEEALPTLLNRIQRIESDTLEGSMKTDSDEFFDALNTLLVVLARDRPALRLFNEMVKDTDVDEDTPALTEVGDNMDRLNS